MMRLTWEKKLEHFFPAPRIPQGSPGASAPWWEVTSVEKKTMKHELEAAFLFFSLSFTINKQPLDLEGQVGKTVLCI